MNLNILFQGLKSSFSLYCRVTLSALTLEDVVTTRTNLALFFELIPRGYFRAVKQRPTLIHLALCPGQCLSFLIPFDLSS